MNKYTSLELSKKLKENGCKLESAKYWNSTFSHPPGYECEDCEKFTNEKGEVKPHPMFNLEDEKSIVPFYPAYDILNDICVKYAKEFFGYNYEGKIKLKENGCRRCYPTIGYEIPTMILYLLQQNKKQEAEDYIWEHCLFNPKNK